MITVNIDTLVSSLSRWVFSAPLSAVLALLLCLGSCQSNDNVGVGKGVSVASLPLTAQIGEASSRVSMSDTYGGAFSCSWNSDQLNIYHSYVLSGAVQNILPLTFGTTATNGTTATFSYAGGLAYCYNPGAPLYAFSNGTGGGYTVSMDETGKSTLTATTLAGQNGTLSDCANYDALYGSTSVANGTGLPGSLAMHHLYGMMNLHLTSSTFSTSYPVTVTLTSSDSNMLPDNGGSATLNADGTLASTGTWGSTWSATVTPTTDGVVDVYFMTWPFSAINGALSIWCADASNYAYTARIVKLSSFSLAAAQLKSKPLAIINGPATNDSYSKLYAWDAIDGKPVTLNTIPTNANTTTLAASPSDYSSRALNVCKDCPSAIAIGWYLSVPFYWDDGRQESRGGNVTSYSMANGSTTKAGMWFRKQSKISGFSSTNAFTGTQITTSVQLSELTLSQIADLKLTTDYFFLPATGFTGSLNGVLTGGGTEGDYWSSSPSSNASLAYGMYFFNTGVIFNGYGRATGFSLWTAQ